MSYRLFVNTERTVLVRIWDDGRTVPDTKVEVAERETPAHTWGPPVHLAEEKWPTDV